MQPLLVDYKDSKLAIAHNRNLTNAQVLRRRMEQSGSIFPDDDRLPEVVLHLIARSHKPTLPRRVAEAVTQVEGLACLILTEDTILGYRDPSGVRPLSLGYLDGMYLLASETCAFDLLGAHWIRDVEPGRWCCSRAGSRVGRIANVGHRAQCMFELVYFSRPDSVVFGEAVNEVRRRMGRALARRYPAAADVVMLDSGLLNSAAQGFADEVGLPFEHGLIRNHYVGRTFIGTDQASRIDAVRVSSTRSEASCKANPGHRGRRLHRPGHDQPKTGAAPLQGGGPRSPLPGFLTAGDQPVPLRDQKHAPDART
ncbi:MAG: hypothetical protein R3E12_10315 [Candidatus Eisenbacteria bacterium]